MTTPTAPILTGRDIGAAEKATRALLDPLIDAADLSFPAWTVLYTIDGSGPAPVDALTQRLVEGLKISSGDAQATLESLLAKALVEAQPGEHGEVLSITPAGESVYRPIRQQVGVIAAQIYSDLPADDQEATVRTLAEVTRRANALLAAAASGSE